MTPIEQAWIAKDRYEHADRKYKQCKELVLEARAERAEAQAEMSLVFAEIYGLEKGLKIQINRAGPGRHGREWVNAYLYNWRAVKLPETDAGIPASSSKVTAAGWGLEVRYRKVRKDGAPFKNVTNWWVRPYSWRLGWEEQ